VTEPLDEPPGQRERTVAARKRELRRRVLAARLDSARSAAAAAGCAARLAAAAAAHFSARGWPSSVAAYLSIGAEPGTQPLIEAVAERGARVIVPVLRPDGDLDWARYIPGSDLVAGARGTIQPTGPSLGVEAICAVDVVFVPALAVDHAGRRLGRGGGAYDRALARVRAAGSPALVIAVVHDDEVLDQVPAAAHDHPVDAALTPSGLAKLHRDTPS
jgi:5-formyltetrahydrofolate cyclo-ligase